MARLMERYQKEISKRLAERLNRFFRLNFCPSAATISLLYLSNRRGGGPASTATAMFDTSLTYGEPITNGLGTGRVAVVSVGGQCQ